MEIIAVNSNGAQEMKTAFEDYYNNLHGKLEEIRQIDLDEYLSGFKGMQASKVRFYVGEIIDAMHTIDEPLIEFKDAIDTVLKNYALKSVRYQASDVNVDRIEGAGDLTGVKSFGEGEN